MESFSSRQEEMTFVLTCGKWISPFLLRVSAMIRMKTPSQNYYKAVQMGK